MLLNKFDFESALQADKKPGFSQGPSNQALNSKPNLFGAPTNHMGVAFPQPQPQISSSAMNAQNKRDLLWEQKKKQKQDLVNPPILRNDGGGMSILDQMVPPAPPRLLSRDQVQFQKAVVYKQPKSVIEIQAPISNVMSKRQPSHQNISSQPTLTAVQSQGNIPPQNYTPPMQEQSWQQQSPMMNHPQKSPYEFQMPVQNQHQQVLPHHPNPMIQMDTRSPPQPYPYNSDEENNFAFYQDAAKMPSSMPSHNQYPQQQQQQPQQHQQQPQFPSQQKQESKPKQSDYLITLQQEIREKEEKKKREKEERIRKEQEELKKNLEYNPFGRAGAGAPVKDHSAFGRKANEQPFPSQRAQQPQPYKPQQMDYQQQFLPQQNIQAPQNVYSHQQLPGLQQPYSQMPPPIQFSNNPIMSPMQDFQEYSPSNMMGVGMMPAPSGFQQATALPQQMHMRPIEQPTFGTPQQHKIQAPPPHQMFIPKQEEGNPKQNGLGIGAFNEGEGVRQKAQKQELQSMLQQQMEEQKRRKEEEKRKIKDEEAREEERIRKERAQIELEFKKEEEKKKAKFNEMQQANAQQIQMKGQKIKAPDPSDGLGQNFVVDKKGQMPDSFNSRGGAHSVESSFHMQQEEELVPVKRMASFHQQQEVPQLSQSRIINDISKELKNNFREEIGKLREEMSSQQRQFREQLDRLKIETNQTIAQKQVENLEVERLKAELRMQREIERLQALERYNPNKPLNPMEVLSNYDKPGSFPSQVNPYQAAPTRTTANGPPSFNLNSSGSGMNNSFYNSQQRGGSRQESREGQRKSQLNNYEKMFFNGAQRAGSQQRPREEPKPVYNPPTYNIKEEKVVKFNQDYFEQPKQQQQPNYDFDAGAYEPKIMKRGVSSINNAAMTNGFGQTLKGESTLLPINYQQHPSDDYYGGKPDTQILMFDNNNKENSAQNNRPTFEDHIQGIGAGMVNHRLNTESAENTMDFIDRVVNGKEDGYEKKPSDRIADKLDGFSFDFPTIPAYEGIQKGMLDKQNHMPSYAQQQPNLPRRDDFIGLGNAGFNLETEGTRKSFDTLNSLNLELVNERNEARLAKFNFESPLKPQNPYQGTNSYLPPSKPDGNEELKKLDNLLFDILRGSEGPGGSDNNRGSSRGGPPVISHINQSNNPSNFAKMRETRDQFMAPKMGNIFEDREEDYEGTFKAYKGADAFKLPSDIRRYDSLLDGTNLSLN